MSLAEKQLRIDNPNKPNGHQMSVAFWSSLLISATVYASVALPPKYLAYLELKGEYYNGQVELVTLEKQAKYLKRVIRALETDPNYAAELARVDFDANDSEGESIPVGSTLELKTKQLAPLFQKSKMLPWYGPAVRILALNDSLRSSLLIFSGALILVAFTFLHDAPKRSLQVLLKPAYFIKGRYVKPSDQRNRTGIG